MNLHLIRFTLLVAMIVAIVGANVAVGNGAAVESHASTRCVEHPDITPADTAVLARRQVASDQSQSSTVNWKRILPGVLR